MKALQLYVSRVSVCLSSLSLLLLLLQTNNVVQGTNPGFLWKVINTTIERKTPTKDSDWNPSNCPRLVFHTNSTLAMKWDVGHRSAMIDLSDLIYRDNGKDSNMSSEQTSSFEFPNITSVKEFLAHESNWTITHGDFEAEGWKGDPTSKKLYEPCITVISIVNGTDMYFNKMDVAVQVMELLQYNTPVRNRHLILVRLAEHEGQLFDCSVFKGSSDFPVRLMNQWEMLLFDFFTDARVIQGLAQESENHHRNTLRVALDPGIWVWLCDDMIKTLEDKRKCLESGKKGEDCRIFKRSIPDNNRNKTCMAGYSPRH